LTIYNPEIKNVFIIRPDNLGDMVLFSGSLHHIRDLYPKADITLFVKTSNLNLFSLCPYIERLEEWERLSSLPFPWLPEFRGKYRLNHFVRHLLNKRYRTDILLLPVRSPTGDLLGMHDIVSSIPANQKIGIAGDYCNQSIEHDQKASRIYSKRMQLSSSRQRSHELEINRDFLRFLGADVEISDIWPEFWTDEKDCEWASNAIPVDKTVITLAICPGVTSSRGKFYQGIRYAEAFNFLKDIRFSIVLFGASNEKSMCLEVANALNKSDNIKRIIDLSEQSTTRQLIEGVKRCDAVISQETGALHIAVALKKPTVGILGGGHFGRFYPWGDEKINRTANKLMDCYWCSWRCIYPDIRCVQEIEPKMIANELELALYEARFI
jgi:ADP-heptose:LPS heptosyltransferase